MSNNNPALARLNKLRNVTNLIACEVCSILVALIIDCIILFGQFKKESTPIILILVLAVLWIVAFVGRRHLVQHITEREKAILNPGAKSDGTSFRGKSLAQQLGPNFRPNKAPVSKTVKEVVYHVVGIILSLIVLFPIR